MANENTTPVRIGSSYVDWGPVFAGAVAAAALSFVLLTAGTAIGLSLISPYPSQSYGKSAATLATGWALVVTIGSFLVGGYIAGRMRMTWGEGNPDEVEFRDGIHGFLMWSLSIFLAVTFASIAGISTTLVGAQAGKSSVYSTDTRSVLDATIDGMMRGSPAASTQTGQFVAAELRDEVNRVLSSSVYSGELTSRDRSYLAQLIAHRTGLPSADAEKRVDVVFADAGRAIDKARKSVVLVGLVTATALLFGLAAAWYAAQRGGHHRDHNIPAKFDFYRRPQSKA